MTIKNVLQTIEEMVRNLKNNDADEKLVSYITIGTLLSRIEENTKDSNYPNYKIYKQDLLACCEVLCGIEKNKAYDDGEQTGRALLAIRKMGSYSCFNVDNHYI